MLAMENVNDACPDATVPDRRLLSCIHLSQVNPRPRRRPGLRNKTWRTQKATENTTSNGDLFVSFGKTSNSSQRCLFSVLAHCFNWDVHNEDLDFGDFFPVFLYSAMDRLDWVFCSRFAYISSTSLPSPSTIQQSPNPTSTSPTSETLWPINYLA